MQLPKGNAASHSVVCVVQKANEAANLGKKWQESILDVCDQHFFFTQVQMLLALSKGLLAWTLHILRICVQQS